VKYSKEIAVWKMSYSPAKISIQGSRDLVLFLTL
jgi:hypothetical protein